MRDQISYPSNWRIFSGNKEKKKTELKLFWNALAFKDQGCFMIYRFIWKIETKLPKCVHHVMMWFGMQFRGIVEIQMRNVSWCWTILDVSNKKTCYKDILDSRVKRQHNAQF
jgi:hypothetical protein